MCRSHTSSWIVSTRWAIAFVFAAGCVAEEREQLPVLPGTVTKIVDGDTIDVQLDRLLTVLRTDENVTVCHIVLFLLSTGCRLNEALSAKWADVDVENRILIIRAAVSKSKRVRSIPLNDSALDVLASLHTESEFEHLFVNRKTGKPYVAIAKVWHRLRRKAGLPHLRLHDMRHQFASFLVNNGRTLLEVQQVLGHADPRVTLRYSHLSSKTLQEAANSASLKIRGELKKAG